MPHPYLSQQPVDDFGLTFPSLVYTARLAATTDTTLTVPPGNPRWKAVMHYEDAASVFVALNATAAAPAGAAFAASTSELNPKCRDVKAGDVLHFFATVADVDVSVSFFAINPIT